MTTEICLICGGKRTYINSPNPFNVVIEIERKKKKCCDTFCPDCNNWFNDKVDNLR
jgi:hypothetical protein